MDLSNYPGYKSSKPGYRHNDLATVGWLDGHVKQHRKSFVSLRLNVEDGVDLFGNDRLVHWNRL